MLKMKNKTIETRILSSLIKVFSDEELTAQPWQSGSMLGNEVYSYQVAYRLNPDTDKDDLALNLQVETEPDLASSVMLRQVVSIQADLPVYEDHDDYLLRAEPGLYPDLLLPVDGPISPSKQWQSVWITVNAEKQAVPSGQYSIKLSFKEQDSGEVLASETFDLTVIDEKLPEQSLIHTMWFHTDCLATWYEDEVFSDAHWDRIQQYVKTAVDHGINMILTPIFTPPLDTQVGGERPTVQLVDVVKTGDKYQFGFDKLKRWVELCRANGVKYFEFAHLFTQWGAKHAPKIMAVENGEEKRIFGWETDATGPEYENFLDQFLPELVSFVRENGLENCSYFHVSDEPREEHLEFYENASRILNKHLKDFPIIDALSSYAFYEKGLVKKPIPASNHIEPFLDNNVPDLWTYYCCSQYKKVANRFFAFPSARSRILGIQLYKYKIQGFLQWGYNFWYSQYSVRPIDPFKVTDAGKAFPSGDPFIVYPGEDGPLESIRSEVFYDALQDLRALILLEEKIGREEVIRLLEEGLESPITFSEYPRDDQWLLQKREQINKLLA
jgi:hypothetical protein